MSGSESSPARISMSARAAVTELFQVHYRRLMGVAALLVDEPEAAEDVVQGAFERLYRRRRRFRDPDAAMAYLTRSVVDGSRPGRRRRATDPVMHAGEEATAGRSAGLAHGAQVALADAVRSLPRRQREVVVLRYYLDLSEDQIAEWLGVSAGSVEQHVSRATATLHSRMRARS